nr:hypothetical protein [Tanacetum cinerariifolium]
MSLTFADTHNMVAYLNKSDASEGFNQVIDFLNESYIKYALTINPHIYVSCIKHFWNIVVVKQTNDVTRLQALVNKKKVVIPEATIRDALCLGDAEGVDCLPNEEIFAELARMGYEKPSTKLTFYKDFFSNQWKFLIYIILQSLSAKRTSWSEFSLAIASAVICLSTGDLSTHTTKYTAPALTQKVFANTRRVEKGFSRVETPLFEGMLVAGVIEEEGDAEEKIQDVAADTAAQGADTTVIGDVVQDQTIPSPTPPTPPPQQPQDLPSTSQASVEHLEYEKVAQAIEITKLKRRVKKLEKANKVKSIETKEGRQAEIYQIDMDHALKVLSMQEDEPAKVQEVVDVVTTAKLMTEVVTAASESVTAASTTIAAAEPQVPAATITAVSVRVAAASTKRRQGVVIRDPEEESTTIIPVDTKSKDKGKRIMVEEPKPLKKKQQVEMDEEEDLESLWSLIKERFSTSKPNNFFDDFLLTTLGAMFKRPDRQAQVCKNQRTAHGQANVKSWKLLESCVRLRVEKQSEMSLELLRFIRQQHQEGQLE